MGTIARLFLVLSLCAWRGFTGFGRLVGVGVLVVRADARDLPLPDGCVDLVVTSPPYFGLRSYTDNGEHYAGQIGSEATPAAYVAALLACTREWVRVLRPSGSLFVNLGDKYNSAASGQRGTLSRGGIKWPDDPQGRRYPTVPAAAEKSLLGLPWRYALAVCDQLGLILRAEIIWAKPNGLPESVGDRVRRAHEQVFHFTVRPRYYSAVDEIREPQAFPNHGQLGKDPRGDKLIRMPDGHHDRPSVRALNPLGKLPGSVWSIPSQPLTVPPHLGVDHFAAFPMELPRRLVLGWSPPGVCTGCGEGRRPVVDRVTSGHDNKLQGRGEGRRTAASNEAPWNSSRTFWAFKMANGGDRITGYACACPQPTAPTRPAVVLDPFGGTGTTALLAHVNGRLGITCDLSADYCRIAAWRCSDPGERARAMLVEKPPVVSDDQGALFEVDR